MDQLSQYAYAIENLQCYAPSLHEVCVAVTLNDHSIFNFDEYLRQYSQAIFPLFVWSIWFYRTPNYREYTINDFLKDIEMGNFSVKNAANQMNELAQQAHNTYTIASRCGVFAKSDIQPLLNQGAKKEDIAASIFQAVVDQTVSGLALERARRANFQADQIIAKYAMGHGGLRPEAAGAVVFKGE